MAQARPLPAAFANKLTTSLTPFVTECVIHEAVVCVPQGPDENVSPVLVSERSVVSSAYQEVRQGDMQKYRQSLDSVQRKVACGNVAPPA
jgi:hypothetical protein